MGDLQGGFSASQRKETIAGGEDPTRFMCPSEPPRVPAGLLRDRSRLIVLGELWPPWSCTGPPRQRQGTAAPLSDPPGCPHRSPTQGCSVFQTPAFATPPCLPCILPTCRNPFLSLPRAQREEVLGCPGEPRRVGMSGRGKEPAQRLGCGTAALSPASIRCWARRGLWVSPASSRVFLGVSEPISLGAAREWGMLWGPEPVLHRVRFAAGFAEDAAD